MFSYVAAVATAVTLMISPVLSSAKESSGGKEAAKWTKQTEARTIEIRKSIEITGTMPLYVLSVAEQQVFRRALLRSVKIVDPGHRFA